MALVLYLVGPQFAHLCFLSALVLFSIDYFFSVVCILCLSNSCLADFLIFCFLCAGSVQTLPKLCLLCALAFSRFRHIVVPVCFVDNFTAQIVISRDCLILLCPFFFTA